MQNNCMMQFQNRMVCRAESSFIIRTAVKVDGCVQGYSSVLLVYAFKVGLSAASSGGHIRQLFGDSIVNERTIRYWLQRFRSRDFSL